MRNQTMLIMSAAGVAAVALAYLARPSDALAQTTEAARAPVCSSAGTVASSANYIGQSHVCVGDLNGDGTNEVVVVTHTSGVTQAVFLSPAGALRRNACWASAPGQPAPTCPQVATTP